MRIKWLQTADARRAQRGSKAKESERGERGVVGTPKKDETEYEHKVLLGSGKVKRKACCIITLLLACNKGKPTEKLPGPRYSKFPPASFATDPLKEPAVPAATTAKSRRAPFLHPATFLACICCATCVCVCLRASTVGCKQVPRLLMQPTAAPPPLPLSLSVIPSWLRRPRWLTRCIASHSHPLETLEAHSA